jgi:thioesterase domain-containing protein
MTGTTDVEMGLVESLCAALRHEYSRIGRLADDAGGQFRQDDPAAACLAALDEITRTTAPLRDALTRALERATVEGLSPAASEALDQTRRVLAESIARIQSAAAEASHARDRLGGQIDEGIQGQKGNRAYRTGY